MTTMLSIRGLSVRFGGVLAVDDLSFEIEQNQLLGLIGPNGAGKTTIMRALTGALAPARGEVRFQGASINNLPVFRRAQLGIGLSQQMVRPFANLTALDNVSFAAGSAHTKSVLQSLLRVSRLRERDRAHALLQRVGIEEYARAWPGELPLGVLKRLELARALALGPRLLLLDEPLAGLNHMEATRVADTIAGLVEDGLTVILIEHNLSEVVRVCSCMIVVDNGKKIAYGVPDEVMADQRVRDAYLGS